MPLNFPSSPAVNDQYTFGGRTWIWNGSAWDSYNPGISGYVSALNGFTGGVTLAAGSGINLTGSANVITIATTGGPGGVGATGPTGPTGPVGDYVISINGLTGILSLLGSTGISIISGGKGITFVNTGVFSFNGLTGAVTGVTTNTVNTFTALQTFDAGISASGISTANITNILNIYGKNNGNTAGLTLWADPGNPSNPVYISLSKGGLSDSGTVNIQAGTLNLSSATSLLGEDPSIVMEVYDVGSSVYRKAEIGGGSITANRTYAFPDASGDFIVTGNVASNAVTSFNGNVGAVQGVSSAVAGTGIAVSGATGAVTITNTGVLSFNGATGAVSGVNSVNGLTGALTVSGGTGMAVLSGGKGITLVNTGVLSVNGSTGAVTNVALTNVNNFFSTSQTISGLNPVLEVQDTDTVNSFTIDPSASRIGFYNDGSSGNLWLSFPAAFDNTVTLPSFNTTLAGLAGTQTFTGAKTFNTVTAFNAGITASGATFTGNINLQNGESIRNTTDGRIDFMPGPVSGTTYGLYMHFTNWGQGAFGPQFGTINSSTGVLDQASLLYATDLVLSTAKAFSLNSNQTNKFVVNTQNTYTLHNTIPVGSGYTGACFAIVDFFGSAINSGNRVPVLNHSHPNLYVYSAGAANANDFIRFEHDRTNANIVTGQTSGILMQPGSGWLGISGGISAAGATFTGPVVGTSGFTFGTGAGLSAMVFYPRSALSGGGLWIRDGQIQIGGSQFGSQGSFYYQPASERFYVFGAGEFNQSYNYEQSRSPLRLNAGPNHLRPILAAYVQTVEGTQLPSIHNDTNMVAGIDNKGVLFSTAGITAFGGISLANNTFIRSNAFTTTSGFTFGSGTTFMRFTTSPSTSYGGLWIRDGVFQIGGGNFAAGQGFWSVNPDSELMYFTGRTEMYVMNTYQTNQSPISIAIGVTHTAHALRISKQNSGSFNPASVVAGCNSNGVWFGTGISANNISIGGYTMAISTGSTFNNIAIGSTLSGANITTGYNNLIIGSNSGNALTTGYRNVILGVGSGRGVTSGYDNMIIGSNSFLNGSGFGNVGVGTSTMRDASTASQSTAVGYQACFRQTTGVANDAIGYNTLLSNTTGSYNVGVGSGSLYYMDGGVENTAVGQSALTRLTSGSYNTAVGLWALYYLTGTQAASRYNTAIGHQAGVYAGPVSGGLTLSAATKGVYIGYNSSGTVGANNEIVIGAEAVGAGSNTTTIGSSTTTSTRLFGVVATGVTAPTIASAGTIAPTTSITFISGTTTINTITAPSGIASTGGQITLIPTDLWSTGTSGNIALATTAVVNRALIMIYDAQTAKWYPSY